MRRREGVTFTMPQLLAHWPAIDADLHSEYGIDTATGILSRRPAEWLRVRIKGLLGRDTRLWAAVRPSDEKRS